MTFLRLNEALELVVLDKNTIASMKLNSRRIFVVTAGMMTEKTPAHDLAVRMLADKKHAIFFVGYADPDSPGGRLKKAYPGDTFVFSGDAGSVTKNCEVEEFDLSAHANREELLDFVGNRCRARPGERCCRNAWVNDLYPVSHDARHAASWRRSRGTRVEQHVATRALRYRRGRFANARGRGQHAAPEHDAEAVYASAAAARCPRRGQCAND